MDHDRRNKCPGLINLAKPFVLLFVLTAPLVFGGERHLDQRAGSIVATAHATGHDFQAVPEQFRLDVVLEEGEVLSQLTFSFELEHLKTGKKKRDREMLHWLAYESFPTLKFTMTGSRREGVRQIIKGALSLHGETQTVEIPLVLSNKDGRVLCEGDFSLTTTDFGLKKIRKMMMLTVDPEVRIHFELDLSTPAKS